MQLPAQEKERKKEREKSKSASEDTESAVGLFLEFCIELLLPVCLYKWPVRTFDLSLSRCGRRSAALTYMRCSESRAWKSAKGAKKMDKEERERE